MDIGSLITILVVAARIAVGLGGFAAIWTLAYSLTPHVHQGALLAAALLGSWGWGAVFNVHVSWRIRWPS